jgi:hypothetical protein
MTAVRDVRDALWTEEFGGDIGKLAAFGTDVGQQGPRFLRRSSPEAIEMTA